MILRELCDGELAKAAACLASADQHAHRGTWEAARFFVALAQVRTDTALVYATLGAGLK